MKLLPVVALSALFLLCGCLQQSGPAQVPPAQQQNFTVPPSGISYTAHYRISDGSGEAEKTVWRSGQNARVRIGTGPATFDLYFLADRAYSCSAGKCFEVTGLAGQQEAGQLFSGPDFSGARVAETVKIGSLTGQCYFFPVTPFESRKRCFTPDMILAYDEYNATRGQSVVEYLTELDYSVSPSDFALPASPEALPSDAQK